MDRAAKFYAVLGLVFNKHAHGSGPEHYSSEVDGLVFEIYPLDEGHSPTNAARVGFAVDDVDTVVDLAVKAGAECVSAPKDSVWGRRAVLRDHDGHSVELVSHPSFSN